ncbi:hypothetical protein ACJ73_08936 [Blastomyces percursus]|uniref:Uncharacterized protein n=1 Tax=Blastomyces percursus TaxID=1658174 RepID=A0A1J9PIP3_9EURO|nr:hypothetical protein ACJ73_08936 [Blastomyces percursus]
MGSVLGESVIELTYTRRWGQMLFAHAAAGLAIRALKPAENENQGAEHRCEVRECTARAGHPCAHLPAKCANCGKGHTALLKSCPARKEARKQAWKAGQKELARQETLSTATPSLGSQEPPTSPPFQETVINRRPKVTPLIEKNYPSSRNVALKDPMRTPGLTAKGPSGLPNLPETPRTQRTHHIPISPIDIDIDIGPEHLVPSIEHLEASQ